MKLWHSSPRNSSSLNNLALLILVMLGSGCAGLKDPFDGSTLVIDRENIKSWNPRNVWEPLPGTPKSYVPMGMRIDELIDQAHGRWIVDPQDGWRFYVPHGGNRLYPRQFLDEMAKTATNRTSKKVIAVFLPLTVALGALAGPGGR